MRGGDRPGGGGDGFAEGEEGSAAGEVRARAAREHGGVTGGAAVSDNDACARDGSEMRLASGELAAVRSDAIGTGPK